MTKFQEAEIANAEEVKGGFFFFLPLLFAYHAPVYQAPAPVYHAPAPSYKAPAPSYQAPKSGKSGKKGY